MIYFAPLRAQRRDLYRNRDKYDKLAYALAMQIIRLALKNGKGVAKYYPPLIALTNEICNGFRNGHARQANRKLKTITQGDAKKLKTIYPTWGLGV